MIALTWVIDVPLATDMAAVRATAQATGDALAATSGLLAGVTGVSQAGVDGQVRNSIAMLTVWANTSRMAEFLWGDATAHVESRLARPSARIWTVSSVQFDRPKLLGATHAGLQVRPHAPNELLAAVVDMQRGAASRSMVGRSTALACRGLDPNTWEDASLDAWTGRPRVYEGRVFSVVRSVVPERP